MVQHIGDPDQPNQDGRMERDQRRLKTTFS